MTLQEALKALKAKGDEKRRAYNAKNGCGDNQFGVAMGDIRIIAKKIKTDHALALQLWETGNADAQFLATLVISPADLSAAEMEKLVKSAAFAHVADWLHNYVLKTHPAKESLREKWMKARNPLAARAGWGLTAERVGKNAAGLDLPALLDRIESEMANADPLVQWTMNSTLAAIGIHHAPLRARALAIGESLGVYRDYPCSKGCTSPFAPIWISTMVARQK
jgi:3-methyladenine DNA glycosylase AlkD